MLDRRLEGRDFIAHDYSIADMASYPWIVPHEGQGQNLDEFPNLADYVARGEARPAYKRAFAAQLAIFKGA